MKKILILISFLIFSVNLFAQVTKWDPVRKKQNFKDSVNFVKLPLLNINDSLSTRAYVRAVVGGGGLPGVLIQEDSSHLQNQVNYVTKYFLKSGYVPITTTVNGHALSGNITVTATDVSLGNVTNESKATMFTSPTFTGTVTIPTPFTIGVISVTANGTELNVLDNIPGTLTSTELGYVDGVTSAIQTQFTGKVAVADTATMLTKYARKASPTFTGTVVLPSTTNIGNISATEIGYIDDATSNIQLQINALLDSIATLRALIQVSEVPHISQIHYVSTSGNDGNDGATTSTPWLTLAYAESHATAAGDTIALKKGDTWSSTTLLSISHSGANGYPITWDGSLWGSGANAKIQASANLTTYLSMANIWGCKYVTLQNVTFDGNNKDMYSGIVIGGFNSVSPGSIQNDEQYITIQNCLVENIGIASAATWCSGILVMPWHNAISHITIQNNTVTRTNNHGIAWYSGKISEGAPDQYPTLSSYCGYNTISKCGLALDNVAEGILITLDVEGLIVEHNVISQGAEGSANGIGFAGGLDGDFPTGIIVRYNDIRLTDMSPITVADGGAITFDCYYNLLYTSAVSGSAGIYLQLTSGLSYAGASMKFYNNTIVVESGNAYNDETNQASICTFKNNILFGLGAGQYANSLINIYNNNTSTVHSNNLLYRTDATNCVHVTYNGGATYVYRNSVLASWEASAKITDPLLTDRAGFIWTLQVGSPAINAGINIPAIPQFDYSNYAVANPPEIGAYEYH